MFNGYLYDLNPYSLNLEIVFFIIEIIFYVLKISIIFNLVQTKRSKHINYSITVTFEELYKRKEVNLQIKRNIICSKCGGIGLEVDHESEVISISLSFKTCFFINNNNKEREQKGSAISCDRSQNSGNLQLTIET